jgi:putative heme iron utilization protein
MSPEQLDVVRDLLTSSRVLALALVVDQAPVLGLLPFAATPDSRGLVVHASRLARHSSGLKAGASFDALLHEPVVEGVEALRVKRLTLRGEVLPLEPDTPVHSAARALYLMKFPEAEPVTTLGDFAFFLLRVQGGRLVTDFGAAANVTAETLSALASS